MKGMKKRGINGGEVIRSAFLCAIIIYPVVLLLMLGSFYFMNIDPVIGFASYLVSQAMVFAIGYFIALRRVRRKFGLDSYSSGAAYLATITLFVILFDITFLYAAFGTFQPPVIGLLPLTILLLMPAFVKN